MRTLVREDASYLGGLQQIVTMPRTELLGQGGRDPETVKQAVDQSLTSGNPASAVSQIHGYKLPRSSVPAVPWPEPGVLTQRVGGM